MKAIYHIKNSDWQEFLRRIILEHNVIAPYEELDNLEYQEFRPENRHRIVYPEARLTQPIKFLLCPPQQEITSEEVLSDSSGRINPTPTKDTVILGITACDLKALSVLDEIFLGGDFVDPYYKARRENTLLISNDCTEPMDVCFCNLLEGSPFPESGFDLNLSFIDDGVLVEAGSEKGKELLEKYTVPMESAEESQLKLRQKKREEAARKLEEINKSFSFGKDIPGSLKNKYDSPLWQELSEPCVGCCACTNICPACHCFLLSESSENLEKVQTWDSCQSTGFARVAGGANPRKKLMERFRSRFYCKFQYKPENFKLFGCTGCGRCITACQGKIDIREVLSKVVSSQKK